MAIRPNRFPRGCRAAAQSHRRFCKSRKRLGSNKNDHQFGFRPLNIFSLKIPTFKPRLCLAGFCLSKPERDLRGAPDPTPEKADSPRLILQNPESRILLLRDILLLHEMTKHTEMPSPDPRKRQDIITY